MNTTLQTTIRNNTTIKYDPKQVCKSSFKRLDVIKIENRRARETLDSSDVQHSPARNYEKSFSIVTQIFAMDLGFDRYMVGSLNAAVVLLSARVASLNELLNQFYQFKVNFFVHGARRRLIQRNERFVAVVSLLFGVVETNCLQGRIIWS